MESFRADPKNGWFGGEDRFLGRYAAKCKVIQRDWSEEAASLSGSTIAQAHEMMNGLEVCFVCSEMEAYSGGSCARAQLPIKFRVDKAKTNKPMGEYASCQDCKGRQQTFQRK